MLVLDYTFSDVANVRSMCCIKYTNDSLLYQKLLFKKYERLYKNQSCNKKEMFKIKIKTKILGLKIKNKIKTSGFEIKIKIKIKIFTGQDQDQDQDWKSQDQDREQDLHMSSSRFQAV